LSDPRSMLRLCFKGGPIHHRRESGGGDERPRAVNACAMHLVIPQKGSVKVPSRSKSKFMVL
jgi:hypothetical protein